VRRRISAVLAIDARRGVKTAGVLPAIRTTTKFLGATACIAARRGLAQKSDAAGRDVTVDVVTSTQKDDAVACWIGLVILQLVVRNDNLGPDIDMFAP
jgi:hypothetical protein